jgi:hypothetical protein
VGVVPTVAWDSETVGSRASPGSSSESAGSPAGGEKQRKPGGEARQGPPPDSRNSRRRHGPRVPDPAVRRKQAPLNGVGDQENDRGAVFRALPVDGEMD